MTDPNRKGRAPTSRLTWACTVVAAIAFVAGGYWLYATVGPGRTVDTSGIRPGMRLTEVEQILGQPDEVVETGDQAAWRYGRTHVWFASVPGVGGIVTEATTSSTPPDPAGGGKAFPPPGGFKGPGPGKGFPPGPPPKT